MSRRFGLEGAAHTQQRPAGRRHSTGGPYPQSTSHCYTRWDRCVSRRAAASHCGGCGLLVRSCSSKRTFPAECKHEKVGGRQHRSHNNPYRHEATFGPGLRRHTTSPRMLGSPAPRSRPPPAHRLCRGTAARPPPWLTGADPRTPGGSPGTRDIRSSEMRSAWGSEEQRAQRSTDARCIWHESDSRGGLG